MDHHQNGSACLDLLPYELKMSILKAMPTVESLRALVMSSSSFYRTFTDGTWLIVPVVLSNEIPSAVMADVEAVWAASHIPPPRTAASVREFLADYSPHSTPISAESSSTKTPDRAWTLSEAMALSRFHSHVKYFTEDLCSSVLLANPISGTPDPSHAPPSDAEIIRVVRAFYSFELYCDLFSQRGRSRAEMDDRLEAEDQQEVFFDKFPPWELEQLGCIRDYLDRKLAVAFDEVAEHDVEWGEFSVEPGGTYSTGNPQRETYLSFGLDFLHRVALASTYEDRAAVLDPKPIADYEFLREGLQEHEEGSFAPEHGFDPAAPTFAKDDPGPYEAWRWALGPDATTKRYYQFDKVDLREWGYCLWDYARLQAWGLFDKPWTPDRAEKRRAEELEMRQQDRERLKRSWDARSKIYQRGGRGWWADGDESKIVWRPTTKVQQGPAWD